MPQINFWCSDIEANLYTYLSEKDDRKRSDYIAKKLRELHADQLNKIDDGSLVIPQLIEPPKKREPKPPPGTPPNPVVNQPIQRPVAPGIFRARENEIPPEEEYGGVSNRHPRRGNTVY